MSELKIQSGGMQNGIFENGQLAFGNALWSGTYIKSDTIGAVAYGGTGYGSGSHIDASGYGAVAHGYINQNVSHISANGHGAVAYGHTNKTLSYIYANGNATTAYGYTQGENSYIKADQPGTVAHGYTRGQNSYIYANGHGAVAHGYVVGENSYIESYGDGAVAHGYTYCQNSYINASAFGSEAHGCAIGENSYIMSNGSGAIAHGYTDGKNSYIYANGPGADAGGYTVGIGSCIEAIGYGSGAYGYAKNATKEYLVDNNEDHSKIIDIMGGGRSIKFNTFTHEDSDYFKEKVGHVIQIEDNLYKIDQVSYYYPDQHVYFRIFPNLEEASTGAIVYDVTNCHRAHGDGSFVFGRNLFAYKNSQTAVGQYNIPDGNALFIVGCGTANDKRNNAFTVDKYGACRGRSMDVPYKENPNDGLSQNSDYYLYLNSNVGNASTFYIQNHAERIFINYSHSQNTQPQIFLNSDAYQPGDIFTIINTADQINPNDNIYNFHGKDGSAGKFTAIDNSTFAFICTQKTFSINASTAGGFTHTLYCRGWVELAHG